MIRLAEIKDVDDILKLLLQVDLVHNKIRPDLFKAPASKYTKEEIIGMLNDDNRPIFVYESNNKVVGYAFTIKKIVKDDNVLQDLKTLYIDDLCVDENNRGMGIGKSLYEYVLNYAKANDYYNITLNVWNNNDNAIKFYESIGMSYQKYTMEKILK